VTFPQTFASACVRLALQRRRTVLVAACGVVLLGLVAGSRIRFDSDVLNLLPKKDPLVAQFRTVLAEFGATDTLLVVLRLQKAEDLELAFALADALEAELWQSPYLSRVEARLQDPVSLADAILAHAPLFLDQEGREELARRLSPEGMAQQVAALRQALETPQAMVTKEILTRDPLGLLPLLAAKLSYGPAALAVDATSGYFLAKDHSVLVLLASPKGSAQDIGFDQELFADLTQRVARAKAKVAEEWEVAESALPEVDFGGGHRIALEDATLIRQDTALNSLTSILGVGLLLLFAFGRVGAFFVASLPLLVGVAATFALAGVAVPNLSQAAAGFSALLVGLGIDFTIVLYARYLEHRRRGQGWEASWDAAAKESGPAIFLGAFTTLATFYAFLPTHFVGLQHLGLLTGTGILFLAFAAFLLLPALAGFGGKQAPPPTPGWLELSSLLAWVRRYRLWVFAVFGLLVISSLLFLPRLSFDDDVRHLRSAANRGVLVREEVAQAFGQTFNAMGVRLEAANELSLLAKTQALVQELSPLVRAGVVARVESAASLVPPLPEQQKAMAWLASARIDPDEVVARLQATLLAQGLVPGAFSPGLALVRQMLTPKEPVTYTLWRGTPLEQLVNRSLYHGDGYVSTLVTVYPKAGQWRREAPPELVALVQRTPGASLVGVNVLAQHLRQVVRKDAILASILGLVAVLALLLWQLRSFPAALACLLPVALGLLFAAGTAAALGLPLNPLNVFVATMVIGIASDYGIHLVHRLREDPEGLPATAQAVALAALTTLVGFGSLVTSHYPGLASIGWMTVFGVFWSCAAALLLLPLLFRRPCPEAR